MSHPHVPHPDQPDPKTAAVPGDRPVPVNDSRESEPFARANPTAARRVRQLVAQTPAGVSAPTAIGTSSLQGQALQPVPHVGSRLPSGVGFGRQGNLAILNACPDHGDRYRIFAITCLYHSDEFWQRLKSDSPAEWDDAVAFDAAIRHGSARANANGHPLRGTFWLHPSRRPLDQVQLRPASGSATGQGCGPWTGPATAVGEVA